MGGKYKKILRSENAKVKLKGVKLTKGLNNTKTDFKIKKIIIKEQLKETYFEDGKQKHNIAEMLARLKHHNRYVCIDALKFINDWLVSNNEDIFQNLGLLIQRITSLCLDINRDVRKESFKVMSTIFSLTPSDSVEPLFDVISSYLKCAMTHIQPNIQEDSLLLLDILLTYLPKLIAANSDNIFLNFLNMISKLQVGAQGGRKLSFNLCSKISVVKWRSMVLKQLQRLLKAMLNHKKYALNISKNLVECCSNKILDMKKVENSQLTKHQFPDLTKIFITIKRNNGVKRNILPIFNKAMCSKTLVEDTTRRIKIYVDQLMPLLFDSWLEIRPTIKIGENKQTLSPDISSILTGLLDIMIDLCELVLLFDVEVDSNQLFSWFELSYKEEFNLKILSQFPYEQSAICLEPQQKARNKQINKFKFEEQYCLQQNLSIILLSSVFITPATDITRLLDFLIITIDTAYQLKDENLNLLAKVLRSVLYSNGKIFIEIDKMMTKALLKEVLATYETESFPKDVQTKISSVLCDIILDDEIHQLYGPDDFSSWLITLPQILIKHVVSYKMLLILSSLAKRGNMHFLKALKSTALGVIKNISSIYVTGVKEQFDGKTQIMDLFLWINVWQSDEKFIILQSITENISEKQTSNYFKFILSETFNN